MLNVERVAYQGWPNCYRLSNGEIELIVTTDVGPRVIRCGFVGGPNEFYEDPATLGATGGNAWRIYGGHRLWHAPEISGRTDVPDNGPLEFRQEAGFMRTVQPVEAGTGIQKEMDITLAASGAHVHIVHRLRNCGLWAVELAPWALSVMAAGGRAVMPLPPRGTHHENLLPTSALVLWAYVDMSDPRWTWGRQYILLRQDAAGPQKIGLRSAEGWLAYANHGNLFVKTGAVVSGATYPDMGSTAEVFTNADILELETLGPLAKLEPGAVVEHVEDWFLFRDVPEPRNDDDVIQHILPKVKQALAKA